MARIDWSFEDACIRGVKEIPARIIPAKKTQEETPKDETPKIEIPSKSIRFEFKLVRYKDDITHEESIKITAHVEGEENGSIVTSLYSLDNDLKQLMKYGVALSPTEFRDLRMAIEENYLRLDITSVSLANDQRLQSLIGMVIEFVKTASHLITKDFCYVPVNQFNDIADDCGYYGYEMRALRANLAALGYIQKQGDRFAGMVRIKDKAERAIFFFRDKLGVPEPKKNEKARKSGANDKS